MTKRISGIAFIVLLVNSAYIAAFSHASIFYMANVLLHLMLGLGLMVLAAIWVRRYPVPGIAFLLAGLPAIFLAIRGNTLDHRWVLWTHIGLAVFAVAIIGVRLFHDRAPRPWRTAFVSAAVLLALLPAGSALYRRAVPDPNHRIQNPAVAPVSMDLEGGGAHSPFAPSSAQTNTGAIIPSNFFMDSELCGGCHKDIYEQWKGSMHHFASFNNQFYRKSIEYMQDVIGTQPQQVVRGLPRSRGVLQRPLRPSHQGTDRYAGGAGRPRLHVVPRHRPRGQQHGERRFHRRISAAPRAGLQQE